MDIENSYGYSNKETNAPVEFETNGNMIPVRQELIINHIVSVLSDFDNKTEKGIDTTNIPNPYHDKIVMPTYNNKFISVPTDLQHFVVQNWLANKSSNYVINSNNSNGSNNLNSSNDSNQLNKPNEVDDQEDDDIIIHSGECECKKCKDNNYLKGFSHYYKFFVCLLIIVLSYYFFNSYKQQYSNEILYL